MSVKGTVTEIVYCNLENGYTVLNLETQEGNSFTVVGYLPAVSQGEVLEVDGRMEYHSKYGEQLVAETYKITNPTTKEGIIRYLSSGLIKGIGEKTAQTIFKAFGNDTMSVIENNPAALVSVKGISSKKAVDIANSVAELKKMQTQIMFLQKFGISTNLAIKIYNAYKQSTKTIVSQNPYRLIDDIDGVGFTTADKIAQSMGHSKEGEFRIRAALMYCLKETASKEGNTFLHLGELLGRAENILKFGLNANTSIDQILAKMALEPAIKLFDIEGVKSVALIRNYRTEQGIATSLLRINKDARRMMLDADSLISQFEKTNNINFHKSQLSAVKSSVMNGVTVITGGPGTGKTTIVKCIVDIFSAQGLRVELCAPTGRASKRLAASTGREAKTIHRMLGYEFKDGKMSFKYDQNCPLMCDVVVVDELSMADIGIMSCLLRAIKSGARLVLVGDKDQLPSVGAGNVLSDIIASKIIEVRYLTHVYRQSQDSLIISNAHLINQGKMPIINNSSKDFFVMALENPSDIANTVVSLVKQRLPSYTGVDSKEIQVLGALKGGVSGVDNLNVMLQEALNPRQSFFKEASLGKNVFRVGDRVMQTVNDYEITYTKISKDGQTEQGQGIFNGDIGFVHNINKSNGTLEVMFDENRLTQYTNFELPNLQLAYAVTVHKSQGSEFDVVVIPLCSGPPTIINKNLLYTAITRAKKLVVLVGSKKVLGMMVRNNYVAKRTTLLDRFLADEQMRFDKFFS